MSPDYPINDGPSLNDVLAHLGYTTRPGRFHGQRDVLSQDGSTAFTGDAKRVWAWLRESEQHQ